MSPILGIMASSVLKSSTAFESIQTTTLGSASTSITLSSIPATFTHLQLRLYAKPTSANNALARMQMNGVTTASYSGHALYGRGSGMFTPINTSTTYFEFSYWQPQNPTPINSNMVAIIDILDYANTNKNKTVKSFAGFDQDDTNSSVGLFSGSLRSTSAISSITLIAPDANTWATGSTVALYGIKVA